MADSKKWITRDGRGQIEGPFTTEKVLYKIGRGELTGDESIAHYPGGNWISISQDPQFYDKLLEVLSHDRATAGSDGDTPVLEFTAPSPVETPNQATRSRAVPVADEKPVQTADAPSPSTATAVRSEPRRRRHRDIELVDVRPQVVKQLARRARLPVFVGVTGLVLAAVLFVGTNKPVDQRLHLIAPQKGVAAVSVDVLTSRIKKGVTSFLKDTLEGYQGAQNDFVYIVERNPHNAEILALLCVTYLQLWPYAQQDSADSKVIASVVQAANAIDPGGVHSATCRTVDLIVRARFPEAKGLVETVLEARANESQPPIIFYFLKGDLLEGAGDHSSALGYLHSAEQLWPQWVLPFMVEAQALSRLERGADAQRIYVNVLKNNPAHTVARIELGLLEYKLFNHIENGEQYLRQALESDDAPKDTLSRGYFGLAEISLHNGNQKRALEFAKKAYSLNASNGSAKNLIVSLGGVQELQNTKVKGQQLIFQGDQFFREGDFHAAQAHYKAAFEEDGKNALAAVKAAQCLWKLSLSTEAIDWLNKAIKADPRMIEAYVTLADYQAQRYNFQAAARVLQQGQMIQPKSSDIYRGFALVEMKRGNPKGAIQYGKRALDLYANDVETQIILADAALDLRDWKMAYNYASAAAQMDSNHRQAQITYARAVAGLQGVDVGVDYLLRLVNNFPLVTEYRLALGRMLLADERYAQAEEVFRQITHLEEKPKAAYVELAKVLRAQGETGEALDLLLKAAVLDPADAEPLYLAGMIYLDVRKPQDASVQFQRVLTINKLFPMVNYQMGRASMQGNDPKAALDFTDREKAANPNLADAYLLAAEAHTLMQQYSNCASEYGRAIKLRPQPALIYVQLAQCNRKAGQLDAAIAMLNVASQKENGLADIYKEQGAIYELKGDVNHAIESYNQYFVLNPDAADRGQIEARITTLQSGRTPAESK